MDACKSNRASLAGAFDIAAEGGRVHGGRRAAILDREPPGQGETFGKMFAHSVYRALVLIALGIFLRSQSRAQTYFTFEDVLTQIGLGSSRQSVREDSAQATADERGSLPHINFIRTTMTGGMSGMSCQRTPALGVSSGKWGSSIPSTTKPASNPNRKSALIGRWKNH